ncbi:MAG: septum formation initiator family protein [Chitinophagaceae bacterium]
MKRFSLPPWLTNKYLLAALGVGLWLLFFDDRDVITTYKHRQELHKLEETRDYYKDRIEETKVELEQLKQNPALLEKYAREKYLMKRDNEDLYVMPE